MTIKLLKHPIIERRETVLPDVEESVRRFLGCNGVNKEKAGLKAKIGWLAVLAKGVPEPGMSISKLRPHISIFTFER